MHTSALAADGRCLGCGIAWPQVADGLGMLPVMLPDVQAAQSALDLARDLLARLDGPQTAIPPEPEALALLELVATWGPAHWGMHAQPPLPSTDSAWLHGWLDGDLPPGPVLVLGCGAGAELCALARPDRELVAMDAVPALLMLARRLANHEVTWLPYRTDALRFAARPIELPSETRETLKRVTWLCGDALDPPFEPETFAAVVALNLLDAVPEPLVLLGQCEALLRPGGVLLLASPYHFQPQVTPGARYLLRWLPADLDLPAGMERLLTGRAIPDFLDNLAVDRSAVDVPWQVRVHPGFTAQYRLHVVRLRKNA